MTAHSTVVPLQQLLEAGFPSEQIMAEARKHLVALLELPEGTEGRVEAIQAVEHFVDNLTDHQPN